MKTRTGLVTFSSGFVWVEGTGLFRVELQPAAIKDITPREFREIREKANQNEERVEAAVPRDLLMRRECDESDIDSDDDAFAA